MNHEWTRMDTNGHEWTRINVARAFQPEFCPAAAMHLENFAGCLAHAKPRSREGKRRRSVFGVRCLVFGGRAADGSPRVRESAGAGPGEWSHAKPRRGSKERFGDTCNRLSARPFRSHEFEFNGMNAVPPDPYGGRWELSAVYLNINANPDSRPLPRSQSSPLTTSLRFISENPCQSVACD